MTNLVAHMMLQTFALQALDIYGTAKDALSRYITFVSPQEATDICVIHRTSEIVKAGTTRTLPPTK